MSQTDELIDVLKQRLKTHGLTYAGVATGLGLSEAAVKRMFSVKSFTLDRMDSICRLMDMEFTDLLHAYEESRQRISHFTPEQEAELAGDIKLILTAVCVRNHWSFEEIISTYEISDTECVRCLARLDKLKLIDLLPGNRIKLRISEDFRWLPDGAIQRFVEQHVQSDFLNARFSKDGQMRLFLSGMLSRASQEVLLRRLRQVAKEFASLHKEDTALPLDQKANAGLIMAFRPWELTAFKQLRRQG